MIEEEVGRVASPPGASSLRSPEPVPVSAHSGDAPSRGGFLKGLGRVMKRKEQPRRSRRAPDPELATVTPETLAHGDYAPAVVVDLTGELGGRRQSMVRVLRNRAATTVDKWLHDGGPGFEEPQRRAIDHIRSLWAIAHQAPALVANYTGVGGGLGDSEGYISALHTVGAYQREFPGYVWETFEQVVRWDEPAGVAGSKLANNSAQQQAHAKACVGFVASKIAEWRGY